MMREDMSLGVVKEIKEGGDQERRTDVARRTLLMLEILLRLSLSLVVEVDSLEEMIREVLLARR